jgi:hypothetical protein
MWVKGILNDSDADVERKEDDEMHYGLFVSQNKIGVSNSRKMRLEGLIERNSAMEK